MAMSGIAVSQDCEKAHERQHKKEKDIQWTVYRIDQSGKKAEIVVECQKEREFCANRASQQQTGDVEKRNRQLWLDFIDSLPDAESRYAVFDFVQPTSSGAFKDAIRFVAWSPDNGSIKNKMIYSSTKDTLKKKLDVQKEVFISSKSQEEIEDSFKQLLN
ncbi:actin-depolymerizing factor 3-like [Haliotis rubra]|uniref:actin-depolymerizing factor 3-like n=1 Tax=Haliotis rubra TaxID=36100 RepID=UPI001EE5D924|nr:actin-depolymerizing factor 3-like [Haliotis rubra]